LPCNFIILRQKPLLAQVVVLILFLFDFQRLGSVTVPGWPLTQQQGPLQLAQKLMLSGVWNNIFKANS
jgi:hypothetical protein